MVTRILDRLVARAGMATFLVLALVTCRPSGCDDGFDGPMDESAGVGGDGAGGTGGGAPQELDAARTDDRIVEVSDRTVSDRVVQYAVSKSGIYVLGHDGVVRVYEPETFKARAPLAPEPKDGGTSSAPQSWRPVCLAVAQTGDHLALGHASGHIGLYHQETLVPLGVVRGTPPLFGVAMSADGKRLVSLGRRSVLWDVATQQELNRIDVASVRSSRFPLAELSQDGARAALYSLDRSNDAPHGGTGKTRTAGRGVIVIWDTEGDAQRQVPRATEASDFALSSDGTLVLTGDYADGYDLYDAVTAEELAQIRDISLASLAMSPDGTRVAVGDTDGNLWMLSRDRPNSRRMRLLRKGGALKNLAFGPNGKWLYGLEGVSLRAIQVGKVDLRP